MTDSIAVVEDQPVASPAPPPSVNAATPVADPDPPVADPDPPVVKPVPPPSVNAAIRITLLNTDLVGMMEITGEEKKRETKILVMPDDKPKGGMSLLEMVGAVNGMIESFTGTPGKLSADQMKTTLGEFGLKTLEAINVELRQIFLFYDKIVEKKEENKNEKIEVTKKDLEYAVCIVITNKATMPAYLNGLFEFKSLSFAIWNTRRPKIIDRMALRDIQDMLGA